MVIMQKKRYQPLVHRHSKSGGGALRSGMRTGVPHTGVPHTGVPHWWVTLLSLAACSSEDNASSSLINGLVPVDSVVLEETPTMAKMLQDESVLGNGGTIIDLAEVFGNGSGELSYVASAGTIVGSTLTLDGNDLVDGVNTLTVTATDADSTNPDSVTITFVLTTDKSPTIAKTLAEESVLGNGGTTIDLTGVFDNGSGELTYGTSAGKIVGSILTLDGSDLVDGGNTLAITATDADGDAVTMDISINANKSPTIVTSLADASIDGNGGTIIDLAGVFGNGSGELTYIASAGTIVGSTLTLVGSDLVDGVNTLTVTATDADDETITDVFEINTTKTFTIIDDAVATVYGAAQHSTQTFNVAEVFAITTNTTLTTSTLPNGISRNNNTLSFDNTALSEGAESFTLTVKEGDDTFIHTLTYVLDTIKDQSGDGSNSSYNGTTLADEITDNTFSSGNYISKVTLNGDAGDDTITGNTIEVSHDVSFIHFAGGDGDDTISGNTVIGGGRVSDITVEGGMGNDTISNNQFESTNTDSDYRLSAITLMGGAGDDVFRDNSVAILNGKTSFLTIDGGDGEDTVVFQSVAGEYSGISSWTYGVESMWLNESGTSTHLIDVETIIFHDGARFGAADAWAEGDGGIAYDLAKAFSDTNTTFTGYFTGIGTISDNTLTLAGTDLRHGANTIEITATASDNSKTTETITVNALKTLITSGTNQFATQTIDLVDTFVTNSSTIYSVSTLPSGIDFANNTLTFDNTILSEGDHALTITATEGGDAVALTLTYAFHAINGQSGEGSNSSYTGTTVADVISKNTFVEEDDDLMNVGLEGGDGDDAISGNKLMTKPESDDRIISITIDGGNGADTITDNTIESGDSARYINLDGGDGDDTISGTTIKADGGTSFISLDGGDGNDTITGNSLDGSYVDLVTFDGGDGDDIINNNAITSEDSVGFISFDGGDGDDSISGNTLIAEDNIFSITFDGGDGNDTISDNHFQSAGAESFWEYYYDFWNISLMGGAGDDVFRNNTARKISGEFAAFDIDGGVGEDTVVFRSLADEYRGITEWLDGVRSIRIIGDGATVSVHNVETISFANGTNFSAAHAWVEGDGGISYDLANVFSDPETTYTAYSTDSGTIGIGNSLTLDGTELAYGANTIKITATAGDTVTTETITINALKTLKIAGAKQHYEQTVDLGNYFSTSSSATFSTSNLPSEADFADNTITFNNTALSEGEHIFTITASDASDGSDAFTYTLTYTLDTMKGQSEDGSSTTYIGTTLADAISNNSFAKTDGSIREIYFNGGAGVDTISNNTISASNDLWSITFDGGDGNDAISGNTLSANDDVNSITFDGGYGNDIISGNTLNAGVRVAFSTLDGGAGDDTISGNTLSAEDRVYRITFDGGHGNDTISDNHLVSTGTESDNHVTSITFMGGAGNDVFRNNTATQANGKFATLTIDGGDGEDTVEFRSIADEYAGITDWVNFSDGGVTTITLIGDGAAVTLIDVETIAFADGASYSAADAWVQDNGGILYDLANVFPNADTTADAADSGTISDNTLSLASTELEHGANTIVITATADGTKTTETITINALKTLKIGGAKQHDAQTIDLNAIFVDAHTYEYNAALPSEISRSGSTISFANGDLSVGVHAITITATDTDASITQSHTLTYSLDTIMGQAVSENGSSTTYTGTTLGDAIMGNSFAETSGSLSKIDLDGRMGNDTISGNTLTSGSGSDNGGILSITFDGGAGVDNISSNALTASVDIESIIFDGGAGVDTISSNALTASVDVKSITFDGGAGDDTINSNILSASDDVFSITFNGGDGSDTISSNTLTASDNIFSITFAGGDGSDTISSNNISVDDGIATITFDGGAGNDTISDNHLESTGLAYNDDVYRITLMGGAGDDEFSGNTATQANGDRSSITINGGTDTDGNDTDKVFFELASGMFDISGGYGSKITVTDKEVHTKAVDGVDSYAEYVLINIEELHFTDTEPDSKYEF